MNTYAGRGQRHDAPKITNVLLAKNSILNLAGQILPLVAGIVALPILISKLGADRFGLLAVVWIVIGYFGLFDLGLGRAITRIVAHKFESNRNEIPGVVWTGLALMAILGLASAIFVFIAASWLVLDVLEVSVDLAAEAIQSFYFLALTIPIVVVSVGLRGVLEAYQRFLLITTVRIPLGVWNFFGPVVAVQVSDSLPDIVLLLAIGRIVSAAVLLVSCVRTVSGPSLNMLTRESAKTVLSFGSWLAVSNILGPLTAFMDRFLVAGLLTVSAVAFYSTPHQIVTRLLIVPAAILGVFFPVFSSLSRSAPAQAFGLYKTSTRYVLLLLVPAVAFIVAFAEPIIGLWIDQTFARSSYQVAQLLAIGVLISSVGIVSQSFIQAAGRPDITAKFSVIELPVYSAYLYFFIDHYGINGAAMAWVLRATISTTLLYGLARWVYRRLDNPTSQVCERNL